MVVKDQAAGASWGCTQPMCSDGAVAFFERHGQSNFLDVCYAAAPPRIQAALVEELEFLRRVLQGSGRVLELGCGNGRLLEALRDCVSQWVGVDFLESYLRHARAQRRLAAGTALVAGRAPGLPFANAVFEVVVCAQNMLGLMGDQKLAVLREAKRIARPQGTLVFLVYSALSLVPRVEWYTEMHRRGMMAPLDWARSTPELLITEDGHASECFRRERLEQLFCEAGFTPRIEPLGELYWAVRANRD